MTGCKAITLTNRAVNALSIEKDTVFWDRKLMGFGVRVYPSGGKVYLAQARGPSGQKRVGLGRHGVLNADDARRQAALIVARIRAGEPMEPPRANTGGVTVAAAAKRYLEDYVAVRLKPRSAKTIGSVVKRHIVPALGRKAMCQVRRQDVLKLHRRLRGKPAQANRAVQTLSRIYGLAEGWGLVPEGRNPCGGIMLYPKRRRERFLTDQEFDRLGAALTEAETKGGASTEVIAAIRLLMLTGCRKNEILSLRWEDVSMGSGELRLRETKTGKPRTIALPPAAVDVLAGLSRIDGEVWVFPGRTRGTHLSALDWAWYKLRERAGLTDVRLHDLRHSYASRALALGESLPMIGKLLGHRRIETTARYAHLHWDAVHVSAEKIAVDLAEDLR